MRDIATLMLESEQVVIAGMIPRDLVEVLQDLAGSRAPSDRTPLITYLTPASRLIWDGSTTSLHTKISWHHGVVALSNLIGGLTHPTSTRRPSELSESVLEAPMAFLSCVVKVSGPRDLTFAALSLPDHFPTYTVDDPGLVAQLSPQDGERVADWLSYMRSVGRPVRLTEVVCQVDPGNVRFGVDSPPFAAQKFNAFGEVAGRVGALTPRAALIARINGQRVLLKRRSRVAQNGDPEKLSILTQRLQDIDLLDTPTPSMDRPNIASFRTARGLSHSEPYVLDTDVYRRAAAREAELTLGIPAVDLLASDRLVYRGYALVRDENSLAGTSGQNGFGVFSLDLNCEAGNDEAQRAMELNHHDLESVDPETMLREREAGGTNHLISSFPDWIDELCFE